jgi:large subunit ribosomal protein L28
MSRRCIITGKTTLFGNNVSHANNKTRRRFIPNLQACSLVSETLGEIIRLRMTVSGLRTIEHCGGLDNWILGTKNTRLTPDLRHLKARIMGRNKATQQ